MVVHCTGCVRMHAGGTQAAITCMLGTRSPNAFRQHQWLASRICQSTMGSQLPPKGRGMLLTGNARRCTQTVEQRLLSKSGPSTAPKKWTKHGSPKTRAGHGSPKSGSTIVSKSTKHASPNVGQSRLLPQADPTWPSKKWTKHGSQRVDDQRRFPTK